MFVIKAVLLVLMFMKKILIIKILLIELLIIILAGTNNYYDNSIEDKGYILKDNFPKNTILMNQLIMENQIYFVYINLIMIILQLYIKLKQYLMENLLQIQIEFFNKRKKTLF